MRRTIYVEKLDVEAGEKVVFDEVILVGGKSTEVGALTIAGTTVKSTVEKHGKRRKVVTFKYKPKKHSHRKQGHHQPYMRTIIDAIDA